MLPALALAFLALLFCLWVWLHGGNLPICVWLLLACAFRRWWIGDWDGDGWWHEKEMGLDRERTANDNFFFRRSTQHVFTFFPDRGKRCHLFSSKGGNTIKLFRFVQDEIKRNFRGLTIASERGVQVWFELLWEALMNNPFCNWSIRSCWINCY